MTQKSDALTKQDAVIIKTLLYLGFQHKRIASLFDVNQGRIGDINTGKVFRDEDRLSPSTISIERYPIKKRGEDR